MHRINDDFILMENNAKLHTAKLVKEYFHRVGVQAIDCPTRDPDLNHIDYL